jgi:hypothetical protein
MSGVMTNPPRRQDRPAVQGQPGGGAKVVRAFGGSSAGVKARRASPGISLILLAAWLCAGMLLMGDWLSPFSADARSFAGGPRAGVASGPRGTVAYSPRGAVAVGNRGGAAVAGPRGAAAVGPGGSAAVSNRYGTAVRGPNGNVVAAPNGRVVPPAAYPPGAYARPGYPYPAPVPVPVPVPVAPAYYGPTASGVAAGVALGAMLTVLPATAIAVSSSKTTVIYQDGAQCYKEVKKSGSTYYQQIACP